MTKNPPTAHTRTEKLGFTLIELLVVISIIAVLAGLAFPAVNGAMDNARKARAKSDISQIATAVVAYDAEYGVLPTITVSSVDSTLLGTLTGNNTRKIVFLETSEWKKGKGGTNSKGWCDPWDSNSVYQIAIDSGTLDQTNYDNIVKAGTNSTNIMKKVAVWSTNSNTSRRVTSW
jgi:prepilin-type N-terminal cleavage/methylation domain-containing protein